MQVGAVVRKIKLYRRNTQISFFYFMSSSTLSYFVNYIYHYAPWISVIMIVVLALAYVIHWVYFDMVACKESFYGSSAKKCLQKQTVEKYSTSATRLEQALHVATKKFDLFAEKKSKEVKKDYDIDVEKKQDNAKQPSATKQSTSESVEVKSSLSTIETFKDNTCYNDVETARKLYTKTPQKLLKAYNELRKQVNTGVDGLLTLDKTQKDIERKEKTRKEESEKANADISKAADERREDDAKQYGLEKTELENDQTFSK